MRSANLADGEPCVAESVQRYSGQRWRPRSFCCRCAIDIAVVAVLALLLLPSAARGQSVTGSVVDSATGAPVRGIVVLLLDTAGTRRNATLVDSLGRFALRAPGAGTYRIRSQKIGVASTTSAPVLLTGAAPVTMTMRVSPIIVALRAIATDANERCSAAGLTGDASVIWGEVAKALTAATLAPDAGTTDNVIAVRDFTRELDPRTMKVRSETTQSINVPERSPYVSPPPDTLAKYGFVVSGRDGTSYYAPDARTLLSDAFAAGHCLRPRMADPAHSGLVGVEFQPIPANRPKDIRGTLWVDAKTLSLQYLEYSYTGEPASVHDSAAGGRVEFAALPSGAWVIRRWMIRMPKFTRGFDKNGTGANSASGGADSVVSAVIEIGGAPSPAGNADVATREEAVIASPTTSAVGVDTLGSTLVRRYAMLHGFVLADPADKPVPGADVFIAPDHSARTNDAGEFRIVGIPPGKHVVVVRHLGSAPITVSLDLAVGDTVVREFDLAPALPALDTVSVRAQRLLSAVTLGKMAGYVNRRAQHIGRAIDSTTLQRENYRDLGDILRAHLPIHLLVTEGGSYVASTRGMVSGSEFQPSGDSTDKQRGATPACYAQVWVNGMRLYSPAKDAPLFDVNSIPVTGLQAVEFFPGPAETPPEYGGTGASCGTLLIWTR